MATKAKIDFTQGGIISKIIIFAIPLILGELFQNLYQSVDSLVVGNFVSKEALAAVSVCSPITNLVVGFFNGMSVGASVLMAHTVGQRDKEAVAPTMRVAFSFGIMLGAVLAALGVILTPQLLGMADCAEDIFGTAAQYLRIVMVGTTFTVIYNLGAGVLRALGDTRSSLQILIVSSCLNIVLDLIFVVLLRGGVGGVAVATVISQGISVWLVYRKMAQTNPAFRISFPEVFCSRKMVGEMVSIGLPAGLQSSVVTISNVFIWRYVNGFDSTAVSAGVGVAQRLDRFVAMPVKTIGLAMTTFTGQNAGAGLHSRSRRGIRSGFLVSMGISVGLGAIVFAASPLLVRLFNDDPEVIAIGVAMMRLIIPFYSTMAVREIFFGALRGYKDTRIPMFISWSGMVGVRQLFLAVSMHYNHDPVNIYWCYPVAWISTSLFIFVYYMLRRDKLGITGPDAA